MDKAKQTANYAAKLLTRNSYFRIFELEKINNLHYRSSGQNEGVFSNFDQIPATILRKETLEMSLSIDGNDGKTYSSRFSAKEKVTTKESNIKKENKNKYKINEKYGLFISGLAREANLSKIGKGFPKDLILMIQSFAKDATSDKEFLEKYMEELLSALPKDISSPKNLENSILLSPDFVKDLFRCAQIISVQKECRAGGAYYKIYRSDNEEGICLCLYEINLFSKLIKGELYIGDKDNFISIKIPQGEKEKNKIKYGSKKYIGNDIIEITLTGSPKLVDGVTVQYATHPKEMSQENRHRSKVDKFEREMDSLEEMKSMFLPALSLLQSCFQDLADRNETTS